MTEFIVRCGCGRAMAVDTLRGRGAFRCGCGARIQVDEQRTPAGECIYAHTGGVACRLPSAITEPMPLCRRHEQVLRAYFNEANLTALGLGPDETRAIIAALLGNHDEAPKAMRSSRPAPAWWVPAAYRKPSGSVVYYIRFADRIKIGTTADLHQRLYDIPCDELLVTEPGGRKEERQRHRQFAHLLIAREWFTAGEDLLAHIAALRKEQSQPGWRRVPQPQAQAIPIPPGGTLTGTEGARALGVHQSTVCGWVRKGYLKSVATNNRGHGLYALGDLLAAMRMAQDALARAQHCPPVPAGNLASRA